MEHRLRILIPNGMAAVQQLLYELRDHKPLVLFNESELSFARHLVELREELLRGHLRLRGRDEELLHDGLGSRESLIVVVGALSR
jgi:hypothetical protein